MRCFTNSSNLFHVWDFRLSSRLAPLNICTLCLRWSGCHWCLGARFLICRFPSYSAVGINMKWNKIKWNWFFSSCALKEEVWNRPPAVHQRCHVFLEEVWKNTSCSCQKHNTVLYSCITFIERQAIYTFNSKNNNSSNSSNHLFTNSTTWISFSACAVSSCLLAVSPASRGIDHQQFLHVRVEPLLPLHGRQEFTLLPEGSVVGHHHVPLHRPAALGRPFGRPRPLHARDATQTESSPWVKRTQSRIHQRSQRKWFLNMSCFAHDEIQQVPSETQSRLWEARCHQGDTQNAKQQEGQSVGGRQLGHPEDTEEVTFFWVTEVNDSYQTHQN